MGIRKQRANHTNNTAVSGACSRDHLISSRSKNQSPSAKDPPQSVSLHEHNTTGPAVEAPTLPKQHHHHNRNHPCSDSLGPSIRNQNRNKQTPQTGDLTPRSASNEKNWTSTRNSPSIHSSSSPRPDYYSDSPSSTPSSPPPPPSSLAASYSASDFFCPEQPSTQTMAPRTPAIFPPVR